MPDAEDEVQRAIARGDFEDLPGAGAPLDLPRTHDPDWWIRRRLEDDDIDRDALLPVVLLLRREHERMDATLADLASEELVREQLEDYNRRVIADRRENPLARMLAPTVEVETRVQRWREGWQAAARTAETAAPPGPESASLRPGARRRRRWWRRGGVG